MKELSTAELQEFRDRCLQAVTYGYEIGLADLYVDSLAAEVGQEIVPESVSKASAAHLLGLANEALEQRAAGGKKPKKAPKVEEKKPEPAKTEEPKKEEPKVEETKEAPKDEEPAKTEESSKDDSKKSGSKKHR